jgi:hypothetical protein
VVVFLLRHSLETRMGGLAGALDFCNLIEFTTCSSVVYPMQASWCCVRVLCLGRPPNQLAIATGYGCVRHPCLKPNQLGQHPDTGRVG